MAVKDAWMYFVPKFIVKARINQLSRDGYHSEWLVEDHQERIDAAVRACNFWPWRRKIKPIDIDSFSE